MSVASFAGLLSEANESYGNDDFEDAVALLSQAIELAGPDDRQAHYDALCKRSNANLKLKNFVNALSDANDAVKLDSSRPTAYLRKAIASHGLGEYTTGKAALKKGSAKIASGSVNNAEKKLASQFDLWNDKMDLALGAESGAQLADTAALADQSGYEADNEHQAAGPGSLDQGGTTAKPAAVRQDWFQSAEFVSVEFFVKKLTKEHADVAFAAQQLTVSIRDPETGAPLFSHQFQLADEIVAPESTVSFLSTKLEVRMKKKHPHFSWPALEGGSRGPASAPQLAASTAAAAPSQRALPPAYASNKDWDKIAAEVTDDKPEGEAALNALFQQIYKDGSDDQRRAMMKSYQESGGTTLSTNWDEIGSKKTEIKPPKGMVAHDWNTHDVVAAGSDSE